MFQVSAKPLVEDVFKGCNIYSHRSNKSMVITSGVHVLPGCPNAWGWITIRLSEVGATGISLSDLFLSPAQDLHPHN